MKYLSLLFIVLFSCQLAASQSISNLPAKEFVQTYKNSKNAVLLDVRTPKEWQEGKINAATCIDFMNQSFKTNADKLDRNNPVFVYCAAGVRSAKASKELEKMGFKKVYNLVNAGHGDLVKSGL